jgi:hypothetical protein
VLLSQTTFFHYPVHLTANRAHCSDSGGGAPYNCVAEGCRKDATIPDFHGDLMATGSGQYSHSLFILEKEILDTRNCLRSQAEAVARLSAVAAIENHKKILELIFSRQIN